ncbi:MAG: NAD(P)H-dependent oxidoreductase subunit E [Oscillospiraceae bacterium]|nr:NAD(P)H-dependent oxidoreductase subunit E [Oscillospiraceae bacterium]
MCAKIVENTINLDAVQGIIDKYPERKTSDLIAILGEIQNEYSYLPEEAMIYVAAALELTPGKVFGVATFYAHFTLEPKGKYVIKVCDGTACHVKKSGDIIKMMEQELGLGGDKITSDDMLFTMQAVACVGACGIAPVVLVNEDVYGSTDVDKMRELIQKIKKEEGAA